jgi:hypothetical protein
MVRKIVLLPLSHPLFLILASVSLVKDVQFPVCFFPPRQAALRNRFVS